MAILLKDARVPASAEDGARVLVDRRRPRGVAEDALELRAWLPELAPSAELQHWFAEKPRQWPLFRRRYFMELTDECAVSALKELHTIAGSEANMTLLTSTADQEHSHAAILRDLLNGVKKPPSTTGPVRAESRGSIRARRSR